MRHRKLIVPEVVQTSAMDCGPASLKCLLEGYGIQVSYGRLREACQTDVDGTSIDTLEELAVHFGLDAEQVMIPVDHLLLPEADAFPAILVVGLANGSPHFIVLWRRMGSLVQVMDPASGRRWTTCRRLIDDIYVHTSEIPVSKWMSFAGSRSFLQVLRRRCERLGFEDGGARLIADAINDSEWMGIAILDAAARMMESFATSGSLRRGPQMAQLLEHLVREANEAAPEGEEVAVIPEVFWSVRPAPLSEEEEEDDDDELLLLRGAVLITVRGVGGTLQEDHAVVSHSPELEAALREPDATPGRALFQLMRDSGVFTTLALVVGIAVAAAGAVAVAILFKSMLDLDTKLMLFEQRLGGVFAVLLFVSLLLLIEIPVVLGTQWLGRQFEIRLRIAYLHKLPRLDDRYLRSRPASDMAERCHSIHRLRDLSDIVGRFWRHSLEIVLSALGIIWLCPSSAPLAVTAAIAATMVPIGIQAPLVEQDLRVRNHAGALSRFYLDALLGLTAILTHGADRIVRREHEGLLVEWARSAIGLLRIAVTTDMGSTIIGMGFATWLFLECLPQVQETSGTLLLLFWALNIPAQGQAIALLVRRFPLVRNTALRLLEPLGAVEEPRSEATEQPANRSDDGKGVELRVEGVEIVAGGTTILEDIDLAISPGEHVAIVGPSGAGKSTLVGMFLGWQRPSAGRILVDSRPLDAARLEALRQQTAWVEPAVQLWNSSLIDNLHYGATDIDRMGQTLDTAELMKVLEQMPNGLQTLLGEGGALVSGGEGQRVRLGRALLHPAPRLVIFDEPFRGLDSPMRRTLLARSRSTWADATLLCITHDLEETLGFDRVLVIEDGQIVEDGAPVTLAQQLDSRYCELLETERRIRREIWDDPRWRKLRMDDGRLSEEARRP
ncbi:MAG: ATP-binding cassette domain-containing protein [Proteobacteria bacterium]|nr:ATP-binding cassette domain-containing protein [Pseudomonadota bacterium]